VNPNARIVVATHLRVAPRRVAAVCVLLVVLGSAVSCAHAGHGSELGSAASPRSSAPVTAGTSRPAGAAKAYATAIAEVGAYLDLWAREGPYTAAAAYLVPQDQPPAGADTSSPFAAPVVLLSGAVDSYGPSTWVSADNFTLYVAMNLHFRGDAASAAWAEGPNSRFFIFTRPNPETAYRMDVATG
jgi:hypothetical protein